MDLKYNVDGRNSKKKRVEVLERSECFLETDCLVRDNFGFGFGLSGAVNHDLLLSEKVTLVRKLGTMLPY